MNENERSSDNAAANNAVNKLVHTPDVIVAQLEACAVEYYGKKKLTRARGYLEQLVMMRPEQARYWSLLGVICRRQNRRGAALTCLKRAAELEPEDFNILVNLGETLIEVGKVPAGVDLLRAVFDEGYDSSKPPEEQDEFTIRSGATLEFVQKSLNEFIASKKASA